MELTLAIASRQLWGGCAGARAGRRDCLQPLVQGFDPGDVRIYHHACTYMRRCTYLLPHEMYVYTTERYRNILQLMYVYVQVRVRYQPWMDAETVSDPSYKASPLYPQP